MRFRRQGTREASELPMTSLIDVVFLLLIYFMLTQTIATKEGELSSALQTQRGEGRAADLVPQIVDVIVENGATGFLVGERLVRTRQDLTAVLRTLSREGGVFIRADDAAPVAGVAAAMQAAHDAGFRKVSYVARRR